MRSEAKLPNRKLQQARRALPSPNRPGQHMTCAEEATEVNRLLHGKDILDQDVDATYIAKLEAGEYHWVRNPNRRWAIRTALRIESDEEIGFYRHRASKNESAAGRASGYNDPIQPVVCFAAGTDDGPPGPIAVVPLAAASVSTTWSELTPTGWRIIDQVPLEHGAGATPSSKASVPNGGRQPLGDDLVAFAGGLPGGQAAGLGYDPDGNWDSFLTVTRLLAGQRQAVAPGALLSLVEAHRDCLFMLFRRAHSDPLRTELGAMVAEASIVASRLRSAQGDRSMALAHCAYARRLADDLRRPKLGAIARIFESNLHSEAATLIGSAGDIVVGLRMLQEAAALGAALNPAAQARLAAEQAQAFAVLKLRRECDDALKRARAAAEHISGDDREGLFSDWSSSRLQVYEGTCQLFLDQPKKAVVTLEQALLDSASDPNNASVNLAARVDLASAYAEVGDLRRSCTMIGDTYGELLNIGNRRGIDRAKQARERLSRWETEDAVQELDERMASYQAA